MKLAKIRLYGTLILYALFALSFWLDWTGMFPPWEFRGITEGNPVILTEKQDALPTEIRQVVSDDRHFYVLYSTYHAVEMYTKDGNYCQTMVIYGHPNGLVSIAAADGKFYISDKHNNLYLFENGDFQAYMAYEDAKALHQQIRWGTWDSGYALRGASLWELSGEGEICVLERPGWIAYYQNNRSWTVKLALGVGIGALMLCPQEPKKRSGNHQK